MTDGRSGASAPSWPASAAAAAHVFVADVEAPELTADDRHHLARVLRLRDGEVVTVADGRGAWRTTVFGASLRPTGEVMHEPVPLPRVGVAFALVKGDRNELVVQKLTELGVDDIVPMHTDRSVVRWEGDRTAGHVERLRRVAREAAMQCRRAWLPHVGEPVPFAVAAARAGAVLADAGGGPVTADHRVVLVGPEGGWSPAERGFDLPIVGLARHVLRAETASIAAAVLLSGVRSS